jgi:hypothetical protein
MCLLDLLLHSFGDGRRSKGRDSSGLTPEDHRRIEAMPPPPPDPPPPGGRPAARGEFLTPEEVGSRFTKEELDVITDITKGLIWLKNNSPQCRFPFSTERDGYIFEIRGRRGAGTSMHVNTQFVGGGDDDH